MSDNCAKEDVEAKSARGRRRRRQGDEEKDRTIEPSVFKREGTVWRGMDGWMEVGTPYLTWSLS